jgi:hypothetical protein
MFYPYFSNLQLSELLEFGTFSIVRNYGKVQNPVTVCGMHRRQSPLESTYNYQFIIMNSLVMSRMFLEAVSAFCGLKESPIVLLCLKNE